MALTGQGERFQPGPQQLALTGTGACRQSGWDTRTRAHDDDCAAAGGLR